MIGRCSAISTMSGVERYTALAAAYRPIDMRRRPQPIMPVDSKRGPRNESPMSIEMPSLEKYRCPSCGKHLEPGFLLGHTLPPRWSRTGPGLTIYHGVPLRKRRRSDGSLVPPREYLSVPAVRCNSCQLGIFGFDNLEAEQPNRDRFVMLGLIAFGSGLFALLVSGVTALEWRLLSAVWNYVRVSVGAALWLTFLISVTKILGARAQRPAA